jgi:non-haem Fe2+, alpha-ketoglutarate-dependent halogenase
MNKAILLPEQLNFYEQKGYIAPVRVLSSEEGTHFRKAIEDSVIGVRGIGQKAYLLYQWAAELAAHPTLVSLASEILGDNILCWGMRVFSKEKMSSDVVPWHQDTTYWHLENLEMVSIWVAITNVDKDSGCLRVLPGSHKLGQLKHNSISLKHNLLSHGQSVSEDIDEKNVVNVTLAIGEVSVHHPYLIHSSLENRTEDRRIGVVCRYVSPQIQFKNCQKDSAWLVLGEAQTNYFHLENPPYSDCDPAAIAEHALAMEIRNSWAK